MSEKNKKTCARVCWKIAVIEQLAELLAEMTVFGRPSAPLAAQAMPSTSSPAPDHARSPPPHQVPSTARSTVLHLDGRPLVGDTP